MLLREFCVKKFATLLLAILFLWDFVNPVVAIQPRVAIHDSELTRFLDSTNAPAVPPTPAGPGFSGLQWWPTNWHYFVMPESLKEVPIEYATGLAAEPTCADDIVAVAIPSDAQVPMKPECSSSSLDNLIQRAGEWLRDIIH